MTATFTLTASDFALFQKMVARQYKRKTGLFSLVGLFRVLIWFCIGIGASIFTRILRENPDLSTPLEALAGLLVASVVCAAILPFAARATLRKAMLSPDGCFLKQQTMQLTEDALVVISGAGKAEWNWASMLSKEEDGVNFYLFVDGMQAIVVPKNAAAFFAGNFERLTAKLHHEV